MREHPQPGSYEFEAWAKEQLDAIHESYRDQIQRFNDMLELISREEEAYNVERRNRYRRFGVEQQS